MTTLDNKPGTAHSDERPRPPSRDQAGALVGQAGRYGVVILGVLLVVLFSALKPATFASWDNYRSILDNQSVTTLLALAVLVPLIVGHFDLSVAGVLAMSQVLVVGLISQHGVPIFLAIV
ncbi:MAG: ribose transport system permease protein, partial [Pseudonocardiales bacterium]|nr:ribose transport system permease protein [Pseudonocardiales bacterium]